jgi:hypothetical protein
MKKGLKDMDIDIEKVKRKEFSSQFFIIELETLTME